MSQQASHRTPTSPSDVPEGKADRRGRLFGVLAGLLVLLVLGVIVLSAYIRLAQSGLGCTEWPACQGQLLREAARAGEAFAAAGAAPARAAHRAVASAALGLIVVLVLLALRARRPRAVRLTLALLSVTLALALLGVIAGRATTPAVVLGNLLGGFVLLALAWRLYAGEACAETGGGDDASVVLRRWTRVALLLLGVQITLGGLLSASYGASACPGWGACAKVAWGAGWDWHVLDLWRATTPEQVLPSQLRGAWLQWLHHLGAAIVFPLLVILVGLHLRAGRFADAAALAVLLGVQMMLGKSMAATGFALPSVWVHSLIAALLLALLARRA